MVLLQVLLGNKARRNYDARLGTNTKPHPTFAHLAWDICHQ